MRIAMMIFGLVFTLALVSQTECFTAGIGNVGKRQLNKAYQSLNRICRETQAICVEAAKDISRRSKTGERSRDTGLNMD
ncbi:hypothetical protein AWC38_SpisGene9970 [Stylophora pistillata]|uniref:Uncharacterized protein n=1 Tax=Stylophora pistillata TaxID=50429 RepID=A0A2B4S9A3_STYPI|nr:hypothetical protein AWC38_SpisGene9970 [Stylophora pistillata]